MSSGKIADKGFWEDLILKKHFALEKERRLDGAFLFARMAASYMASASLAGT